jgi:hypothetical protein
MTDMLICSMEISSKTLGDEVLPECWTVWLRPGRVIRPEVPQPPAVTSCPNDEAPSLFQRSC